MLAESGHEFIGTTFLILSSFLENGEYQKFYITLVNKSW